MKYKLLVAVLVLLFSTISIAVSPFFFKGYAHVNGALAPNGTVITVYVNDAPTPKNSVIIGQAQFQGVIPTGIYTISFEANTGDNVTFRVNNISLIASNGTNTSSQRLGSLVVENFNLSVNKTADGSACAYDAGCTGGFCVHGTCRSAGTHCGDGFCDSGESCTSDNSACGSGQVCTSGCTTNTTTAPPPAGGGGGGAAAPAPVEEKVTVDIIIAETPKTIDITKTKDVAVDEIVITTKTTVASVSVTVKESAKPADAPAPVTASAGAVYKYIEITTTNIATSAISAAKVKFKVPKSWLTSNNIDANTVKLNRNVGTTWEKLSTSKVSEDTTDITYEAETPGFSTFAITGEKIAATPTPAAVPSTCGNNYCDIGYLKLCESPQTCSKDCSTAGYEACRSQCAASDQYPLYITSAGCVCTNENPCALALGIATPVSAPIIAPPEKKPADYTLLYVFAAIALIVALYFFIRKRADKYRLFKRHKQPYIFRPHKHHK